jgi:uncharacterized alkaline shock family protein YloU
VAHEVLSCRVAVSDLLTQVADHNPPADPEHQRTCPTCRATLAELEQLWAPMAQLAAEKVHAPASLLETIMAKVRQLPRNTWYAVIPTPGGDTRIAARVVGALARLAAEEVPQVSLALGGGRRGTEHSLSEIAGNTGATATDIGVAGTHVVIDVQIVVQLGARIPELAELVRDRIARRVADFTGLTAAEVNITVVDVLYLPDSARISIPG